MSTVRDLLATALSSSGRLVAGEAVVDTTVSWAVTARSRTPALDPLQGGEIVLLPMAALRFLGGERALAGLLPGFRDAGAVAVCIWFEADHGARSRADLAQIPLIEMADVSPVEVERGLLDQIAGQMRSRLRQQQDRQTHLFDTLAANRGLETIIRVLSEHVGRMVAYVPSTGPVVTSSSNAVVPEPPILRRVENAPEVTTVPLDSGDGVLWLTPVLHRGARLGVLAITGAASPPSAGEALSIRQVAAAVSVEQGRLDAAAEAEQRQRTLFSQDLFAGRALDTLYGRARALGITLPTEGFVTVVAAEDQNAALPEVVKDRLHGLLNRQASYPLLDQGKALLMLMPPVLRGDSSTGLVLRTLAPLGGRIAVGVSDTVAEPARVADAVEEAQTALLVSRRTRGGAPTRFSETGAYGLLAPLRNTPVARRMVGQMLDPLLRYDEQHHASLTETLETYMVSNGNASVTARQLNLHRNSLAYRLRQIEDLTGLPLSVAENRLLLALALRLQKLA